MVSKWIWLELGQNRGNANDEAEFIVRGLCAHDPGALGATES